MKTPHRLMPFSLVFLSGLIVLAGASCSPGQLTNDGPIVDDSLPWDDQAEAAANTNNNVNLPDDGLIIDDELPWDDEVDAKADANEPEELPEELAEVDVLMINDYAYPTIQFHEAEPDACSEAHWHADGLVVDITITTSDFDHNPFECGFGKVSEVERKTLTVPTSEWELFEKAFQGNQNN